MGKVLSEIAQYGRDGFVFPIEAFSREEALGFRGRLEAFERAEGRNFGKGHNFKPHLLWRVIVIALLLALAACAAKGDNDSDNDQHRGFYGGVSGGWH